MTKEFVLKVDLLRSVPFLLDALIEISLGLVLLARSNTSTGALIFGWIILSVGAVQFIRKIKSFHLLDSELIIKRPLFPFALAEHRFLISKVKEIKFINVPGRFGGPHLTITTDDIAESFRIQAKKENIDEFENRLRALGVAATREGM